MTTAEILGDGSAAGTLKNEDFASGIGIDKFDGLQDELDSYVDKVPLSGTADISGDLNFSTSSLNNVNEIETSTGTFTLSVMRSEVDAMNFATKLDILSPVPDATKKYYLSTDATNTLTWKELTTENLIQGATNFYFSSSDTQGALAGSDLQNASDDIADTDTVKKAMQRLGKKKETYLSQTGTPNFLPGSVTFSKLNGPTDSNGGHINGLLHYDTTSSSWSYMDVNGFNLVGKLDPTNGQQVNEIIANSAGGSNSPGDFYVVEKDGDATGIIGAGSVAFNEGDWIVWDGAEWRKIDYNGKVVSIHAKKDEIAAGPGQYNWRQVVIDPYTISSTLNSPNADDTKSKYLGLV